VRSSSKGGSTVAVDPTEVPDEIWTPHRVALYLKVSVRKVMRELRKRSWKPTGIPWFKVGRDVRFWSADVQAWAEMQRDPLARPKAKSKSKR
jgi:hypothetical protein